MDLSLFCDIIIACVPIFSSIIWTFILLFASGDCLSRREYRLKKQLLSFFSITAFAWFCLFSYRFIPPLFVYLNAFAYLTLLFIPLFLYRFIFTLTAKGEEKFSFLHFLFPILVSGSLFIWSFFIPWEVQLKLVEGRGAIYPGFEPYSYLFLSKPGVRLLFCFVYTTAVFVRLLRYYKRINKESEKRLKPAPWIIELMALTFSILITSFFLFFASRDKILNSAISDFSVLLVVSQHILLVFNVTGRHYIPFVIKGEEFYPTKHLSSLEKRKFERWIKTYRPYRDASLHMPDMAKQLKVSRNQLSTFINTTYGINFNRYINQCRLREVERLLKIPSNAGKSIREIAIQAGFSGFRDYIRVKKQEQQLKE